jgi:3-methyladenine DNA glycosylase AlkD
MLRVSPASMADFRLGQLQHQLRQAADPAHAAFHQDYHKSELDFLGVRTPQLRAIVREVFPTRPALKRDDAEPLVRELWGSDCFEERTVALMLLTRIAGQLTQHDVPWLHRMTRDCEGWGPLDYLVIGTLSPLALRLGDPVYEQVRAWSTSDHMWTRRASILVHIVPARKGKLSDEHSWPTFEELLPEREFFIRKAIGWTLRECGRHYPEQVCEFLSRVGGRASGLTRREGSRNLPQEMQDRLADA